VPSPSLETKIGPVRLENPLLLASGILGETAESMVRVHLSGAAGVVTKSIGLEPRRGYVNPTVFEFEGGLLNAMGLPNPGIEYFRHVIRSLKAEGIFTVGSIFDAEPEGFANLGSIMQEEGADAVELNLSCPHARGVGSEVGSDPGNVSRIVRAVRGAVGIPVWAKLTPNTHDIAGLASAAEAAGADAIVAINTVRAMAISSRARMPVLSNASGGLSGRAVKYIGLKAVYDISSVCSIPVIGVGGIYSGTDVAEYLMAGASAVQIGTAVAEHGPELFSKINAQLLRFMKREHFSSLEELKGIARKDTEDS